MGQSVSIAALSAGSAGINVRELEDLTYEKTLSSARFMKCVRARHQHGLVVVKVAMRPPPDFKLTQYAKAIRRERDLLADVPNALGYQRIVETENCGFLVRQYLHSSLYDRMSTRPFLDDIEKKWLAYQLLCAVRDCHTRNVYHGDIKTENILVTSWNWLYLSDFSSSFKKTYLPEDNPADFSYFFDISGRRTCYLAPERFLGAAEEDDGRGVTWAMDIFSVGCVIAELFVETPIFSLSQLFKYRKGDYDALGHLNRIHDKDIRELVTHMIQVEPEARYSAEEYLNFWRRKAFPEYFYSFLHQYMGFITDPSSGRVPVLPETTNFGDADDRIDRVYYDFDKISYFLGYENAKSVSNTNDQTVEDVLPVQIDIPNNRHVASKRRQQARDDGTLIFLTLVVSALRNTARATSRVRACDLMLALGERITDESKLDRILPYLIVLLNDKSDAVVIAAIRTMTQLLELIDVVSPVNAYVFTEYIRPRLQNLVESSASTTKSPIRATYAACLASLAHTSLRILDMVQALRSDGSIPTIDPEAENGSATDLTYKNLFDVARADLVYHFEEHTKSLLTDSDASVRRAFLGSISSLCVFFGSPKANDVVLSHLNTYLNDRDWMLKCAFLEKVVGVAIYVGSSSLEDFILPLMLPALSDPEEFVLEKVLLSFANMAEHGLLQRSKSWEMVDIVARFMVHPNIWIREAAVHFITNTTKWLSLADNRCIILPLIRPYLKIDVTSFTETAILDALQRPLPRAILDMAFSWSLKTEKGLYWRPVQTQRTFSFGPTEQTVQTISSKDLTAQALHRVAKNDEDEQWLTRLRNLGMSSEDELKLLALRDYIHRVAYRRSREESGGSDPSPLNNIIKLRELHITPQTVFFENQQKRPSSNRRKGQNDSPIHGINAKHTLTDALLDASTTLSDPLAIRKKSIANNRKERLNGPAGSPTIGGLTVTSKGSASDLPSPLSSSPSTRTSSFDHAILSEYTAKLRLRDGLSSSPNTELRSDGSLTPTESLKGQKTRMRHSPSAMNLLNRRDTQKAFAETSTDVTHAIGEMDGPFTQDSTENTPVPTNEQAQNTTTNGSALEAGHTYEGADPSVTRLLDTLASENYQVDELDLGPLVNPVSRRPKRTDIVDADGPWRPQGIHIATFGEHTASINRILPSPDHMFFITASDDGTVRVWDTLRLERNLIHKSRQTHKHAQGAQVKCIAFVENTHSFTSCATDGVVNVVKVDCVPSVDTIKYGKLQVKRTFSFPTNEFAVWCEHFRANSRSTLMMATSASRIVALDLRTMTPLYTLTSPLNHGVPTTFCLDRKRNWLLLGTSRGILSLYDLRFRLCIKSWGLSGATPIRRLILHPSKGRGRWVCVVGGTSYPDISVWDIEKTQCRDVFCTESRLSDWSPDQLNLKELAKAYQPVTLSDSKLLATPSPTTAPSRNFVRAVIVGSDAGPDERESKYGFLISGGTDRKVRFWDLLRVEASATVSGLAADEAQPRFSTAHPVPGLVVNVEKASGALRTDEGKGDRDRNGKPRVSRAVAIVREQKGLLRGHLDDITDVALLEGLQNMIVSVDRKGCIYVFQ